MIGRGAGVWASSLLLGLGLGCGSSPPPKDELDARRLVVEEPGNREAVLALARSEREAGRHGAELELYLRLHQRRSLGGKARSRASELLLQRALARVGQGDPQGAADFDLAEELGSAPLDPSLSPRRSLAHDLDAAHRMRHSSEFERARAAEPLSASPPSDLRRILAQPEEELTRVELELAIERLEEEGAYKRALAMASEYVRRGGEGDAALASWYRLHRWWYGERRGLVPTALGERARQLAGCPSEALPCRGLYDSPLPGRGLLEAPWARSFAPLLSELRAAHASEPMLAERKAREYLGRWVYPIRPGLAVVESFHLLGDRRRAREFAELLVELAPRLVELRLVLGLALISEGNVERADLELTRAAAESGDPGWVWSSASLRAVEDGEWLYAIESGRKGISLTAQGGALELLVAVARSQAALGRTADCETTLAQLPASWRAAQSCGAAETKMTEGARRATPPLGLLGPVARRLGLVGEGSTPPR